MPGGIPRGFVMLDILKAIVLGIVEGITEFLPVSSTGHLLLFNTFINFNNFNDKSFNTLFDIFIQFGAILAVILFFWDKIFPFGKNKTPQDTNRIFSIWLKILVGIIPGLILGLKFSSYIENHLFQPYVVAITLFLGGIFLIYIESRKKHIRFKAIDAINFQTAFLIGLFQCIAMIPGVSRSAATIIGAMLLGASRVAAAEFSFYLAIPTMFGASLITLYKHGLHFNVHEVILLCVGFFVAFLVAWVVIAGFMKFISHHDFKPFGWYRIAVGALILVLFLFGVHLGL